MDDFGRLLRTALARLRRSTAYGVLGLAAIAIAGCSKAPGSGVSVDGRSAVYSWADPATGCLYLIFDHRSAYAGAGGITPRLRADGKPDCDAQRDGSPKGRDAETGPAHDSPVREADAPKPD